MSRRGRAPWTVTILVALTTLALSTACGDQQGAEDTEPAAEGITATIHEFADIQGIVASQNLICADQRITSDSLIRDVRTAEERTRVPLFKPFPPDDRDYPDFLASYREVTVPDAAVTIDESGRVAGVDVTKVEDNKIFVDTGQPLRFQKSDDGRWLFCDDVFLSREAVTESATANLNQAKALK